MKRLPALGLILLLLCSSTPVAAQECDYDNCALRLKFGWSASIVAGTQEHTVASLGMFPSSKPIDLLAQRSDRAAELYRGYRSQQVAGSLLSLAGLGLFIGSLFVYDNDSAYNGGSLGLLIGGAVVGGVGAIVQTFARDKASQAVWEYNRTLVR